MAKNCCYLIKDNPKGFDFCPLCNKPLNFCCAGCYCSDINCTYLDGYATLTNKEARKHKDKIIR